MSQLNRIGRYHVDDVWRTETLGRVVRARVPEQDRPVYIKELSPPPSLAAGLRDRLLRAFEREYGLLAEVDDSRVARPYDYGAAEGGRYVVFDRPEAAGFAPLAADPRAFGADGWTRAAAETCRALAALCETGPPLYRFPVGSLFLSREGSVRLLHLELAHLVPAAELPPALRPAADPYLSPEERDGGEPGPASLVFSTAAWLYTMLAGSPARCPAERVAGGREPARLWEYNPDVRAAVDDALRRALARDPAERHPSLRELADALGPAASAPEPARRQRTPPAAAPEAAWTFPQAGAWILGLGAAGAMLGYGLARLLPH